MTECTCIRCVSCKGFGYFWDEFDYSETGQFHETCEDCGGAGITEECDRCMAIAEEEEDERMWNDHEVVRVQTIPAQKEE